MELADAAWSLQCAETTNKIFAESRTCECGRRYGQTESNDSEANFTQSALSLTGADAAIPRLTMTPDERVLSYEDAHAILRVRAHALCCGCCRLASESLFDDESVNFFCDDRLFQRCKFIVKTKIYLTLNILGSFKKFFVDF